MESGHLRQGTPLSDDDAGISPHTVNQRSDLPAADAVE